MNKQETIVKLENLNTLYNRLSELRQYIDNDAIQEAAQKINNLKKRLGNLSDVPTLCKICPAFYDADDAAFEELKMNKERSAKLFKISLIGTVICILILFIFHWSFFSTIGGIGVIASLILGASRSSNNKKYDQAQKKRQEDKENYDKSMAAFRDAMQYYDQEKAKGIASAREYSARYTATFEQVMKVLEEWQEKKAAALDEWQEVCNEIEKEDILTDEYAYMIPKLILLLKSGRADSLKEALNTAIEEERAEARAAALIEQEQRRTQIMQQQMDEERRHNQQMEHQAELQSKIQQEETARAQKLENKREYVPGVNAYRDKYGNYYNLDGIPIAPPTGSRK